MALILFECAGLYLAKKTINGVYNTTYNLLFGSETYKINKKLDYIIEQNEIIKKELKNNVSNNHQTIIYKNCELKLIDNYIVTQNNNLSKSMFEKSKTKKCNEKLSKSCYLLL